MRWPGGGVRRARMNGGEIKCNYQAITDRGTARGKNPSVFWSANLISISVVPPQNVRRRRQSFVLAYLSHSGHSIYPPPLSLLSSFPPSLYRPLSRFCTPQIFIGVWRSLIVLPRGGVGCLKKTFFFERVLTRRSADGERALITKRHQRGFTRVCKRRWRRDTEKQHPTVRLSRE